MSSKLMLVLHSHIPYVKRQGKWPFGEVWLFEAMAETYIPLLVSWIRLREQGKNTSIALSISPTLMEQLKSRYIQREFVEYLNERESRAAEDERYYLSMGAEDFARNASIYRRFYRDVRRDFTVDFNRDIIGVFKELQDMGSIEVMTTAATHAYLPLLDSSSLYHQIDWGMRVYHQHFNREPRGFWLPECGYFQGIEDILLENGIKYFYVDGHAIEGGRPIEVFSPGSPDEAEFETFADTGLSTYRPYRIKGKDITVFGRNAMVSHQVWSADYGYPGDADYREFHKQDPRSGFKYWRVTDRRKDLGRKKAYDPELALGKVQEHAVDFVKGLEENSREAKKLGFNNPCIVGCYDTELFGHWWWEGVQWLEMVFREIEKSDELEPDLPSNHLHAQREAQVFESSWGMGGKHYVWNNNETAWMWEIIRKAGQEFESLKELPVDSDVERRAICQAMKELMLIQSSDWLFMVSNNLTRDYAMKRFFEHYTKLLRLCNSLHNNNLDRSFVAWLEKVEYEDDFFNQLETGGTL